jgi:acyl carrier protein
LISGAGWATVLVARGRKAHDAPNHGEDSNARTNGAFRGGLMADAVTEKVIATLASVKRIPADKITPETNLQELGIDSLDVFSLLFELENAFKISIPDDDVRSIRTVNDIVEGVKKLIAAAPPEGSVGSASPAA